MKPLRCEKYNDGKRECSVTGTEREKREREEAGTEGRRG